ncbi:MAG: CotH kinase family protein [Bacteroidota bacterium]
MIVSDAANNSFPSLRKLLGMALALLAFLFLGWVLMQPKTPPPPLAPVKGQRIHCNAELVSDSSEFLQDGFVFNAGEKQSKDRAFSGQFSCKVDSGQGLQFGFGYDFGPYEAGDLYRATVWRYQEQGSREGYLVASAEGEGGFYFSENLASEVKNGWEKIQLSFQLPLTKEVENVKVYVYTSGRQTTYFDDLTIEKIGSKTEEFSQPLEVLSLNLSQEAMQRLRNKRVDAFQLGILKTTDNDWVKGLLHSSDSSTDRRIKLRLKGDWLDHLEDDKWSFRIRMRDTDTWRRMREFSLHTPKARAFLMEWVLHEFFKREDVLTTRYDFVQLKLNDKNLGVYAAEEHFDKVLLEYNHRREGPIVKFIEDGFWEGAARSMQQVDVVDHDLNQTVKKMEAADIRPFKENQLLANPVLAKQFESAHQLMHQYRYGLKATEDLFDLDKLARYYAICDIMGAYHGMAWHNQRFYFDPLTNLLEPIGFDGFGGNASNRHFILGQGALNPRKIQQERLDNKLFQDKAFTEKYVRYLYRFSSTEYIKDFLASIETDLRSREILLEEEFENASFDRRTFFINTRRVRSLLLPFDQLSLRAYTQKSSDAGKQLQLTNTHGLPLEVVGFGPRANLLSDSLAAPVLLEGFYPRLFETLIEQNKNAQVLLDTFTPAMAWQAFQNQEFMAFTELNVKASAKYLFYRPLGLDTIFHAAISPWKAPIGSTPRQALFENFPLEPHPAYRLSRGMLYFKKGKFVLDKPLCIPAGLRVHFEAGCEMDIREGGMIVSRSPIFMYGQQDTPIIIRSSDGKGGGLTVLQAAIESEMNYAIFDGLDRLKYQNWELTGAVTFYESDVSINHSIFRNNNCEDGLNIVRSEFSFNNSLISDTFSDGLDADFCKGYISNSTFLRTGNDGMDLSGSVVLIDNCTAEDCGDKGVSIGEESDATIFQINIKGSPIGVASKDLSVLTIRDIQLEDCDQGFTAYQKKPEYGGGKIIVQSYLAKNVKRLYNIRKGSSLQLKKKLITDNQ